MMTTDTRQAPEKPAAKAKKPWVKPEVRVIKAGSAENSTSNGNDGKGGQTGS